MNKLERGSEGAKRLKQSVKMSLTAGEDASSSYSMLKNVEKVKRHIVCSPLYAGSLRPKGQVAFSEAPDGTAETDPAL